MKNKGLFGIFFISCALVCSALPAHTISNACDRNSDSALNVGNEKTSSAFFATTNDGYQGILNYSGAFGVSSITTSSQYPFTYDADTGVLTSGNAHIGSSISEMKIEVIGSGSLVFEYNVLNLSDETDKDFFIVNVGSKIASLTSYSYATFYNRHVSTFTTYNYSVVAANETDVTTIYIGYKKNGKDYGDKTDTANVKNISFIKAGQKATVNVTSSNSTYGTVTGGGQYSINENVTINATPTTDGVFYCWQVDGKKTDYPQEYTFSCYKDLEIVAIFGSKTGTVAQNLYTGKIYTSVKLALDELTSGKKLMLLENATLDASATIVSGAELYVPFSNQYVEGGTADGNSYCSSTSFAPASKAFATLTINSDVTLTVYGKLLIGGTIGYPTQNYQGHTSDAHGKIINNGTITINGGELSCYGFIEGNGSVNEINNAKIYEPFIVFDFAGGSNTYNLFDINQNPFTQYTMQNISCELDVEYGSHLYALCNLYASGDFNKTVATIVGTFSEGLSTLYALKEGSSYSRTVDKTKSISGATCLEGGNYGADIYRVTNTINGGASLNNFEMEVWGFSIAVKNLAIPYCTEIVLENGDYVIDSGYILYPGSTIQVSSGATLNLNGDLFALEGLYSTGMSGKYYPNSDQLQANGFTAGANLIVNGSFIINSEARFGGIVQTTAAGSEINVKAGAVTSIDNLQLGGTACYDDNTNVVSLNGRVRYKGKLVTLDPGKRYESDNLDSWTKESYTINKYVTAKVAEQPTSGEYALIPSGGSTPYAVYGGPKVIEINETMYGSFVLPNEIVTESCFSFRTFYSETDDSKAVVTNIVSAADSTSFTISSTSGNEMYKHLVEYKINDGEYIAVSGSNGSYSIENLYGDVSIRITSGLKGDVNLSETIAANDVNLLKKYLAGYTGLTNLKCLFLADLNDDGRVSSLEVNKIKKYLAGYINML